MIAIYEQGSGRGIGHNLDSFIQRFFEICQQHLREKRAKAFAFIFYDFKNAELRKVLKDQGVFAQLDRLSADRISIFYLHTGSRRAIDRFNQEFLSKLGVSEKVLLPCVVFFKFGDGNIRDIEVAQLDHADLIHGFKELYDAIDQYIGGQATHEPQTRAYLRWVKASVQFLSIEAFRAILKQSVGHFF
jgi:hypothetical protein